MSKLMTYTTKVSFTLPTGGERRSLYVTTLSRNPEEIKKEAAHKAEVCYGWQINDVSFGD
jgi:hypothetical protein